MAGPYLPLDTKDTRQQPPVTWPPCWQHCRWQVPPASSRPWGMGLRCRSPRLGQDSPPFRVISIPLVWPTGVPQIKWINSSPRGSLGLTPCCRGLNENVLGAYRHSHDYSLTLEDTQGLTDWGGAGTGDMNWISEVCFQSKPICSFVALTVLLYLSTRFLQYIMLFVAYPFCGIIWLYASRLYFSPLIFPKVSQSIFQNHLRVWKGDIRHTKRW